MVKKVNTNKYIKKPGTKRMRKVSKKENAHIVLLGNIGEEEFDIIS